MKHQILIAGAACLLMTSVTLAQTKPEETEVWEPEPDKVTFSNGTPSDAIVLFSGENLDAWTGSGENDANWVVDNGIMTVRPGAGAIMTKKNFGDVQLHIEWRSPQEVSGEGQGRGNSGVFLSGKYEVQVLDSYNNRTYSNGQAGSIYKQYIPYVNATRAPGEWQTYDIIFVAPEFDESGNLTSPARLTVFHNGVLIQYDRELKGNTVYIGEPSYEAHGDGPIVLQDHGNPVSFRNIWVRELSLD